MPHAMRLFRQGIFPVLLAAGLTACAEAATTTKPYIPAAFAQPGPKAVPAAATQDDKIADAKFAAFVQSFRATALAQGIRPETYDRSMAGIVRNPRVEQANLTQPEFVKPVWDYLDGAVSDKRVSRGIEMMGANEATLARVESRFGVAREYLVAMWGIESDYGIGMGHFNMFEALATLAYDGPRMEYARRELIAAFKMEERDHLDPKDMTSSWAGAFGQTQFVPSSFLANAVDVEGNGHIDLWHSVADALGSSALLLANAGWKDGAPWGYEVALPADFDFAAADSDIVKHVSEWKKLGVKKVNGDALADSDREGSIIVPAGAHGPAFIVFDNFKTVLKYNNAQSYALAVCLLAQRIKGGPGIVAPWPRQEVPLTRDERVAFQTFLKKLGYDPGDADGVLGHKARAALRAFQKAHGLPADGFATVELLERLEREIAAKGG